MLLHKPRLSFSCSNQSTCILLDTVAVVYMCIQSMHRQVIWTPLRKFYLYTFLRYLRVVAPCEISACVEICSSIWWMPGSFNGITNREHLHSQLKSRCLVCFSDGSTVIWVMTLNYKVILLGTIWRKLTICFLRVKYAAMIRWSCLGIRHDGWH